MKVAIFYDNDLHVEKWKPIMDGLVDQDTLTVSYSSIYNPYNMKDSFFTIFLITPQQAVSKHLLEKVAALMEAGAHEKSILFIINDKDQVSPVDRKVVGDEIANILEKYNFTPEMIWTSSHGYNLYHTFIHNQDDEVLKKELRYTYWNHDGDPLTFQDMMNNREMELVLEDSGIPALDEYIEKEILPFTQRVIRRDPSKRHVVLVGGNRLIRDVLSEQDNLMIYTVDDFTQLDQQAMSNDCILFVIPDNQVDVIDYGSLGRFSSVTVLVDGEDQKNVWEIALDRASPQPTYPNLSFVKINSFYLECLKRNRAREDLLDDPFIVIRGPYGFPIYKDEVVDWDEALLIESGIPDVMKAIVSI